MAKNKKEEIEMALIRTYLDGRFLYSVFVEKEQLTEECEKLALKGYELEIEHETNCTQQCLALPEVSSAKQHHLVPTTLIKKLLDTKNARILRSIKQVSPPAKEVIIVQFLTGKKSIKAFYLETSL
ncbi:MAG: hypothetical protein WC389_17085 [Lutibacter sp.]|jgi:hypothetical protein